MIRQASKSTRRSGAGYHNDLPSARLLHKNRINYPLAKYGLCAIAKRIYGVESQIEATCPSASCPQPSNPLWERRENTSK